LHLFDFFSPSLERSSLLLTRSRHLSDIVFSARMLFSFNFSQPPPLRAVFFPSGRNPSLLEPYNNPPPRGPSFPENFIRAKDSIVFVPFRVLCGSHAVSCGRGIPPPNPFDPSSRLLKAFSFCEIAELTFQWTCSP